MIIFGEDVGYFGRVFRTTDGLQEKHGDHRVFDTPLSEGGIAATAFGMGLNGLRPIVEIQFADYIFPAYDQIVNEMAKIRHRSEESSGRQSHYGPLLAVELEGASSLPIPESNLPHPWTESRLLLNPIQRKGLLISSVECNDPVIFFEPKRCYRGPFYGDPHKVPTWSDHPEAEVPEGEQNSTWSG